MSESPEAPMPRSVVCCRGPRAVARAVGSGGGPAVLAEEENGWHTLATLPGARYPAFSLAVPLVRFQGLPPDTAAVALLHLEASYQLLMVQVPDRAVWWSWGDTAADGDPPPAEATAGEVAEELRDVLAPDADVGAIEEALSRSDDLQSAVADLARVLGLPGHLVVMLHADEADLPAMGEGLLRSGARGAWVDAIKVNAAAATGGAAAASGRGGLDRLTAGLAKASDGLFGTVWLILGVMLVLVGGFLLATGAHPRDGVLLPGNPLLLMGLGVALAALGALRRRGR